MLAESTGDRIAMSHLDELLGNLDDLQRTKSGLQKALSTETRMNRELTDLRGRDR
jgi:hypothetical protein